MKLLALLPFLSFCFACVRQLLTPPWTDLFYHIHFLGLILTYEISSFSIHTLPRRGEGKELDSAESLPGIYLLAQYQRRDPEPAVRPAVVIV